LMGETFRQNGYTTYGTGKWHNGTDSYRRSFSDGDEIFFGGMWDHWNVPTYEFRADGKYNRLNNACIGQYFSNKVTYTRATHINVGVHSTDLFTDKALEWIKNYNCDEPFFMYVSYLAPHDPRTMPEPYDTMYDPDKMPLECFAGEHFRYGIEDVRDEIIEAYPRKVDAVKKHLADYFGMISHIDNRLGDLIRVLKEKGLYDNTIIVFTGDNGLAVGRHGLMGKQSCYEHSIRVPLIMTGPGIPKDLRDDSYLYLYDIFPTLCSLCNIEIPDTVEGIDFSGLSNKRSMKRRKEVYAVFSDKVRTVKDDRFKLIEYRFQKVAVTQLFDLKNDPLETCNLADNPRYAEHRERLTNKLIEHGKKSGDMNHKSGQIFWSRYFKDPDFVEPEVVNWMVTMYKPDA
jgi:arylsulfatase A-like enzyme